MNRHLPRTIIFGGSGFIGGRLSSRLRLQGVEVCTYSSAECNLFDLEQTRRVIESQNENCSIVFCSGVSRVAEDSMGTFVANTTMAHHLIEALAKPPESIIFLSSTDVYGLPAATLPITERTLARPTTYYGISKHASEFILRQGPSHWPGQTCPIGCLRLPGIYGPGDHGCSVVGAFYQRLVRGETVPITGDGQTARDFVHVDDLCALIEQLLANPINDVLNVAGGVCVTPRETAECLSKHLGVEPNIQWLEPNPARDHDLVFDVSKLREIAPACEFRSLDEGVRDYIRTERERGE